MSARQHGLQPRTKLVWLSSEMRHGSMGTVDQRLAQIAVPTLTYPE
jgi:hypothetical protein